jgi:predicted acylesterase/phospholipase RssA
MRNDVRLDNRPLARVKPHRRGGRRPFDCIALLLQGGGALGAYQGGVYEGLTLRAAPAPPRTTMRRLGPII